jgi:hypothetical protein
MAMPVLLGVSPFQDRDNLIVIQLCALSPKVRPLAICGVS